MGELVFKELHIRERIVSSRRDRIPFKVRAARRVDYVNERVSLTKVVEEFVAETSTLMRFWDETGDIEEFDRDETRASFAWGILRLASMAELCVRASLPHEGHASVRFDCRERIVRNLDGRERRRSEEG